MLRHPGEIPSIWFNTRISQNIGVPWQSPQKKFPACAAESVELISVLPLQPWRIVRNAAPPGIPITFAGTAVPTTGERLYPRLNLTQTRITTNRISYEKSGRETGNPNMTPETVIAVDAMGGDAGPLPVIRGIERTGRRFPSVRFILSGDEQLLKRHMGKSRILTSRCTVRHAPAVVEMTEAPGAAFRRREATSMWGAIQCVANGDAAVAMSCGNTGALAVLAATGLKTLAGSARPAIAALWPSKKRGKLTVMLDMGAHYTATPEELRAYGIMGAAYARIALGVQRPRVALLNIGAEKLKGHPEVREADKLIADLAKRPDATFDYIGFVEGDQITANIADVIVTDGFTGNVALKTAEGIARFIREVITVNMRKNLLSRFAVVLAYPSFRGIRNWMDPRRLNGGVLLGLNGVVVKSHGRADAKGVEAALSIAIRVAERNLPAVISRELQNLSPDDTVDADPRATAS